MASMINAFLFLLGISVGSFLNVLIDRIPNNESFLKGRSHCDYCDKTLQWYDLIPLISFVMTFRKCRYCHKNLSFQYPIIECITGLSFVLIFNMFLPYGPFLILSYSIFISGFIVLFVMDFKYQILADEITLSLIGVSGIVLWYQYIYLSYQPVIIVQRLGIGILASLGFLFLAIVTKGKGMGGGDIKLVFLMGLILGFPGIITSLYVAFVSGGIIAGFLLFLKKKHLGQTIPFGPFLIMATIITMLYPVELQNLFLRIFRF